MKTGNWLPLLLLSVVVLAGCATGKLPKYAAPSVSIVTDEDMDMSDVISYRQLTRDDFRGSEPPSNFDERMAAVTCVYTQPQIDKDGIEINPVDMEDGVLVYEVIYNNLRYRALMNRSCSWWNPRTSPLERDYVLEHEQIHFALFEAAAREWNELPPLKIRVRSQDIADMQREVQKQFEAQMQRRLQVLREENLRFDEDTSMGHKPAKQKEWLQTVLARLQKSSGHAAVEAEPDCRIDEATSRLISRARAALEGAAQSSAMLSLLDEAEAAAGPPECDNVRARILADKAVEMATE
ncbi:MAG: hypothetical protein JSU67_00055 [Gammaproteobacteria bacterium]|nr:MAG: hypothetical protein EP300_13345 [Gammaproteobacteria bacterium]UCH40135.1 MAG: hypothetical protein JSU67_00055 [Gammaproteobacteria bacterium]